MAKFKEGDKVKAKDGKVYTIGVVFGDAEKEPAYECLRPGAASSIFSESELKAANSAPLASTNAVVQNAINARRARNASSDVMVKAWEDFVEDAGRFIRSTSLSRLVGLAAKTPDDEAGKRVRDAIDAATSEISAVTDKIQNIIRKYGSRI